MVVPKQLMLLFQLFVMLKWSGPCEIPALAPGCDCLLNWVFQQFGSLCPKIHLNLGNSQLKPMIFHASHVASLFVVQLPAETAPTGR
jgi:hypothetical protein